MSHALKSQLWNELKAAGIKFEEHYREYSTEQLQAAVDRLHEDPDYVAPEPPAPRQPKPQVASQPQAEYAGQHAYTHGDDTPIREDADGLIWYREEVLKPATPRPRARRKISYVDTGVKKQTVVDGRYIETVEVAGDQHFSAEVRITMPSYQVGVYKDPRFPFKIHIYNGVRGFDLFDVQKFYGGGDLVPSEVLRLYVANDLCYDIRTTIRAIQSEYREQQLRGAIQ